VLKIPHGPVLKLLEPVLMHPLVWVRSRSGAKAPGRSEQKPLFLLVIPRFLLELKSGQRIHSFGLISWDFIWLQLFHQFIYTSQWFLRGHSKFPIIGVLGYFFNYTTHATIFAQGRRAIVQALLVLYKQMHTFFMCSRGTHLRIVLANFEKGTMYSLYSWFEVTSKT
jgi:hypothetical protein